MWFWLRNQVERNRQANNAPRRAKARKQTAVPKVRLLLDMLETRAVPTVSNQQTGQLYSGTDAIQQAITDVYANQATFSSQTLQVDAADIAGFYDGFTVQQDDPLTPLVTDGLISTNSLTILSTSSPGQARPVIRATKVSVTSNPAGGQAGIGVQINAQNVNLGSTSGGGTVGGFDIRPNVDTTFTGNLIGVVFGSASNSRFQDNTISGYANGMQFQPNVTGGTVTLNEVFSNGNGVRFFGSTNGVSFTKNVVQNNTAAGVTFTAAYVNTNAANRFTLNRIVNNAGGAVVNLNTSNTGAVTSGAQRSNAGAIVDFSFNDFGPTGPNAGPGPNGGQSGFGTTPSGSNGVTIGNVDITPFITSAVDTTTGGSTTNAIYDPNTNPNNGVGYNVNGSNASTANSAMTVRVTQSSPQVDPSTTTNIAPFNPGNSGIGNNNNSGRIQEAINAATGAGLGLNNETANVEPGTWREALTANVSLSNSIVTVQGLNNGAIPATNSASPNTPNPARGAETILNPTTGPALVTTVNGVTFQGFTIDGNDPNTAASQDQAIGILGNVGARNLKVNNNVIQNYTQFGVEVIGNNTGGTATLSTGNTVDSNLITNIGATGGAANAAGVYYSTNAYGTISNNFINRGTVSGAVLLRGIRADGYTIGSAASTGNPANVGTAGSLSISGNRVSTFAVVASDVPIGIVLDNSAFIPSTSTNPNNSLANATFAISNNTIGPDTGSNANAVGIFLSNLRGNIGGSGGNTITDAPEAGSQLNAGMIITQIPSASFTNTNVTGAVFGVVATDDNALTLTNGTIASGNGGNTQVGVLIADALGTLVPGFTFAAANGNTNASLIGLTVSGVTQAAVRALDNNGTAATPTVGLSVNGGSFGGNGSTVVGFDIQGDGAASATVPTPGVSATITNASVTLTGPTTGNNSIGVNAVATLSTAAIPGVTLGGANVAIGGATGLSPVTLNSTLINLPTALDKNLNYATGVNVQGGTLSLGPSNVINGGVNGLVVNNNPVAADHTTTTNVARGTVTVISPTTNGSAFNNQSGDGTVNSSNNQRTGFIVIGTNVMPGQEINATSFTFNAPGVTDNFIRSDRIVDRQDFNFDTRALVRLVAHQLFVTQSNESPALGGVHGAIQRAVNASLAPNSPNNADRVVETVNVQGGPVQYLPVGSTGDGGSAVLASADTVVIDKPISVLGPFPNTNPLTAPRSGALGTQEAIVVAPVGFHAFTLTTNPTAPTVGGPVDPRGPGTFADNVTIAGLSVRGSTTGSGATQAGSADAIFESAPFGNFKFDPTPNNTTNGDEFAQPGTVVRNNFISNFLGATNSVGAAAVSINATSSNFTIATNDIGNNLIGVNVPGNGTGLFPTGTLNGTLVSTPAPSFVQDNTFHDFLNPNNAAGGGGDANRATAIVLGGNNPSLTVSGNDIVGQSSGSTLRAGIRVGAGVPPFNGGPSVISNNSFRNFSTASGNGAIVNGGGLILNAPLNWFGTNNPGAISPAAVGTNVDFSPYLNSGTDSDPTTAFRGDQSVLVVLPEAGSGTTVISPQIDPDNPIQEGYKLLPTAGGTVLIEAGASPGVSYNRNIDTSLLGAKPVLLDFFVGSPTTGIDTAGVVVVNGNVKFSPNTTLRLTVNVNPSQSDLLQVNGTFDPNGAKLSGIVSGTTLPTSGNPVTVVTSTSPPAGNFTQANFTFQGSPVTVTPTISGNSIVLQAASTTAFVNDVWTLVTDSDGNGVVSNGDVVSAPEGLPGTQNLIFGFGAFSNINLAIGNVSSGATTVVNVIDGAYAQAVNINKDLTLQALTTAAGTVTINPVLNAGQSAILVSAANASIQGNTTVGGADKLIVTPGAGSSTTGGITGISVTSTGIVIQDVQVNGFNGSGSAGILVGPNSSAQILSDTVTGNNAGVRVNQASAKVEGNDLSNNTSGGAQSAGLVGQGGAAVDAGGGATGMTPFSVSTGNNTFAGYVPGGAQAINNRNDVGALPSGTGAVTLPNLAAQNNVFSGAVTYGAVEAIVRHNTDDPFSAAVDFRNAFSAAATPVAAPAVIDASYLFVSRADTEGLAAVQKSLVRAIQFQINAPVVLANGAITVNRSGATSYGWYTGALPTGAVPTSVTSTINGSTGLTTVTVTFTSSTFTEPSSAATVSVNNGLGTTVPFTLNSNSLIDGRYNNTVNGALISLQFGGSITAQTPAPKNFLRFYGDLDGDGVLSNTETISAFRSARDNPSPFDPFRPFFDIDANGQVTNAFEGAQLNSRLAFGGFLP